MKRAEIVTDTNDELKEVEEWLISLMNCPFDNIDAFVMEDDMTHFYDIKDGKVEIGKEVEVEWPVKKDIVS